MIKQVLSLLLVSALPVLAGPGLNSGGTINGGTIGSGSGGGPTNGQTSAQVSAQIMSSNNVVFAATYATPSSMTNIANVVAVAAAQSQWLSSHNYVGGENFNLEPLQWPWSNTNIWNIMYGSTQPSGVPTNAPMVVTNGYLSSARNTTNNTTLVYIEATNAIPITFAEITGTFTTNDINCNYAGGGNTVIGSTIILSPLPIATGNGSLGSGPGAYWLHMGFTTTGMGLSVWTNGVGFGTYTNEIVSHGFTGGFNHVDINQSYILDGINGGPSVTNTYGFRFINYNTLQMYFDAQALDCTADFFTNFTGSIGNPPPYTPFPMHVAFEMDGNGPGSPATNKVGAGQHWLSIGYGDKPMDDGLSFQVYRQPETNTTFNAFSTIYTTPGIPGVANSITYQASLANSTIPITGGNEYWPLQNPSTATVGFGTPVYWQKIPPGVINTVWVNDAANTIGAGTNIVCNFWTNTVAATGGVANSGGASMFSVSLYAPSSGYGTNVAINMVVPTNTVACWQITNSSPATITAFYGSVTVSETTSSH